MSKYKDFTEDELENLLSQFLINSWSYTKLSQFARNEKAFEMVHIYGERSKSSATTVAGQAYHYALDRYFNAKMRGDQFDLADLEMLAFEYIEEVNAAVWKVQKTTPTIAECKAKALKVTTALLLNFYTEKSIYEDEIKEIIAVEEYFDEFLSINGVDIPMPCHARIDLIVRTIEDKVAVIDHKSKNAFTDEEALKLAVGVQAITYVDCYESKYGEQVDEVWFIENKYSANKDKSKQLNRFKLIITIDVRRLYEALLYEPLKRMLEAVNEPDYLYLINESDTFQDKAEIYQFWAKTMMSEVEDFNVHPSKKDLVAKRLKKIRDASLGSITPKVIKQFKENASEFIQYDLSNKDMSSKQKIEHVLRTFGTVVEVAHEFDGYSSNTFLLEVSAGVKISAIQNHKLDIANQLNVSNVRISKDLTVYNDRSYVSIECAKKRDKDLMFDLADLEGRKIPIGKDNYGQTIVWDLDNHSTPHVLVCGATGSGKSVCVKSTIEYALTGPANVIIILDPKYEFTSYARNPRCKVFNDIIDIETAIADVVVNMNEMVRSGQTGKIVIIFDEFADAVASSRKGNDLVVKKREVIGLDKRGNEKWGLVPTGEVLKPLEENFRVILQKGRSSGIRVMAATQRASVKVITGDAKVNFPVQICFRVPKEADSRVVLDEPGAESLAGRGDGLIRSPQYDDIVRFQAYYKN